VSSAGAWLFFIVFLIVTVTILQNVMDAVVLDSFLAQLELNKLKAHGIKSPVQTRIEKLAVIANAENDDDAFDENDTVTWKATQKLNTTYAIVENIFREELERQFEAKIGGEKDKGNSQSQIRSSIYLLADVEFNDSTN